MNVKIVDVWTIAFQNYFWDFATFIFGSYHQYKNIFIFYVIVSRKTNICTLKKAIPNKADIVTDYQNQINQTDYIQLENLE